MPRSDGAIASRSASASAAALDPSIRPATPTDSTSSRRSVVTPILFPSSQGPRRTRVPGVGLPLRCHFRRAPRAAAMTSRTATRERRNSRAIAAGPSPASWAARTRRSCPGVTVAALPDAPGLFGRGRFEPGPEGASSGTARPRRRASSVTALISRSSWPSSSRRSDFPRSAGRARPGAFAGRLAAGARDAAPAVSGRGPPVRGRRVIALPPSGAGTPMSRRPGKPSQPPGRTVERTTDTGFRHGGEAFRNDEIHFHARPCHAHPGSRGGGRFGGAALTGPPPVSMARRRRRARLRTGRPGV